MCSYTSYKRNIWGPPPLIVVGVKGDSKKDISKWCPDSLVVISSVPVACGTHHSLLQSLISFWVRGNWPIMVKAACTFHSPFYLYESFKLSTATSLMKDYQALAVYFHSARNWRIVFLLQTPHRRDAHTRVFVRIISVLVRGRISFSLGRGRNSKPRCLR